MKAILNVAVGERYLRGQDRLIASLDKVGETSDRLFWRDEWPPGSMSHSVQPYGFKTHAIRHALRRGYDQVLWLDAVCLALKPFDAIWRHLEHQPALVLADGWNIGEWTSDRALEIFGLDRDFAMGLQLCLAGVHAIDLASPKGRLLLELMEDLRDQGSFVGPWRNEVNEASLDPRCRGHRHDQSALSWATYAVGIPMARMPSFVKYEDADAPDACIWVTGV